jgi:hypothetical protein
MAKKTNEIIMLASAIAAGAVLALLIRNPPFVEETLEEAKVRLSVLVPFQASEPFQGI